MCHSYFRLCLTLLSDTFYAFYECVADVKLGECSSSFIVSNFRYEAVRNWYLRLQKHVRQHDNFLLHEPFCINAGQTFDEFISMHAVVFIQHKLKISLFNANYRRS